MFPFLPIELYCHKSLITGAIVFKDNHSGTENAEENILLLSFFKQAELGLRTISQSPLNSSTTFKSMFPYT